MIVTLDTNVIYQAVRNPSGAAGHIIALVSDSKLQIALSNPVFLEYVDVLTRSSSLIDLSWSLDESKQFFSFLSRFAKQIDIHYLFRPNLRDENDNMLVELAITSNSRFLITNNTKDFVHSNELKFDDLNIIRPDQFMDAWRKKNV